MPLSRHHLTGMKGLTREEIETILTTAESLKEISFRDIKKVPTLRGKTVVNFFHEPSTRTRTSFEIAAKRLSADTVSLSAGTSSLVKGETLIDTAKNLEAMNPDVIVIRHSMAGAPHLLSRSVKASIINAGDGMHEHPTQALLDLMTIREKKEPSEGSPGGDHRRYRPQPGGPIQYHRTENHGGPSHGGRSSDHDPSPFIESLGVGVTYQLRKNHPPGRCDHDAAGPVGKTTTDALSLFAGILPFFWPTSRR